MDNVCPNCGRPLERGSLFSTKDGAFSFAEKVPSALENARRTPGFIAITGSKVGRRTAVPAEVCRECKTMFIRYE